MMVYVYVMLASAIAAAGVWFLVRPLTRGTQPESREQYFQLQTVRDRLLTQLNELDLDDRDHSMEHATAADERVRLQAELADVLAQLERVAPAPQKMEHSHSRARWRGAVLVLVFAVPSLAAVLYWVNITVPLDRLSQLAAVPAGVPPQALMMVQRLEQRLRENPEDVQGWLRLGRSYAVLGRIDDATLAYENAYRRLPKNYEADSPEAFWFLGLAAYHGGDTKHALAFWQQLLAGLPPESESAMQLRHVIDQAKQKGAEK